MQIPDPFLYLEQDRVLLCFVKHARETQHALSGPVLVVHASVILASRTCHRLLLLLQEACIAKAGRGRGITASKPLEGLIAIHRASDEVSSTRAERRVLLAGLANPARAASKHTSITLLGRRTFLTREADTPYSRGGPTSSRPEDLVRR